MQVRHEDVSTALLLASAQMLESGRRQLLGRDQPLSSQVLQMQPALAQFADRLLTKHSKYLHQQLGSTVRHKSSATVVLLGAVARQGGRITALVVKMLDDTLPAVIRLAHPPKYVQHVHTVLCCIYAACTYWGS